jgi:hypothetical protein
LQHTQNGRVRKVLVEKDLQTQTLRNKAEISDERQAKDLAEHGAPVASWKWRRISADSKDEYNISVLFVK